MAIDWTRSMQQTFEFYIVDPKTWRNKTRITTVISCSITRDMSSELLESASIECEATLDECYVRIYMVCFQDGFKESIPLGTFLVQTPSSAYDGRVQKNTLEAYSPLIELKDARPEYGYALMKGDNVMEMAHSLAREHLRAPVVSMTDDTTLQSNFISDFDNDTWLSFLTDLIAVAKYSFSEDEMGNIMFAPSQKLAAMRPRWIFNDDNSSIIMPDVSFEQDLYGVPNVVEVLCSSDTNFKIARAVNDDPTSSISTVSRGREVVYRESNPSGLVNPTQAQIDQYARDVLESQSSFQCTVSFKHGYCGVRVGDCVLLNYERAGLYNIKAMITSQTIDCKTGCIVNAKAVYTKRLWEVGP